MNSVSGGRLVIATWFYGPEGIFLDVTLIKTIFGTSFRYSSCEWCPPLSSILDPCYSSVVKIRAQMLATLNWVDRKQFLIIIKVVNHRHKKSHYSLADQSTEQNILIDFKLSAQSAKQISPRVGSLLQLSSLLLRLREQSSHLVFETLAFIWNISHFAYVNPVLIVFRSYLANQALSVELGGGEGFSCDITWRWKIWKISEKF